MLARLGSTSNFYESIVLMPKEAMLVFNEIVTTVQKKHKIKSFGFTILKMAELAMSTIQQSKVIENDKNTKKK